MLLDNAVSVIGPAWDAVLLGGGFLAFTGYKAKKNRVPAPAWKVRVAARKELVDVVGRDSYYDKDKIDVNDQIIIRLERGDQVLKMGTVNAQADDVEEQIDSIVAKAQEKASSLNARM